MFKYNNLKIYSLNFWQKIVSTFLISFLKSSDFKYFQFLWKKCEYMSNRQKTVDSHSNTPSENETDDNNNYVENNTDSLQGETSEDRKTIPTDNTQQNPQQILETSYTEIFTWQRPNPSVETQKQFSEFFSSEQSQAENERLRLQHQRSVEDAKKFLR